MKTQEKTYVIVNKVGDSYDYFTQFVSFDKKEIDKKCASLNRAYDKLANTQGKISWDAYEKRKQNRTHVSRRKPVKPYVFQQLEKYIVLPLNKAIENLSSMVADAHTEHDASY